MSIPELRRRILAIAEKLQWLPPALTRIALGTIFVSTGWGKLHNLDQVTEFFTGLGIPFPGFNAVLTALTELGCGLLILLGLATRLASLPLIVTMCVAIATAKWSELEGFGDFVRLEELLYIVLFGWLALFGAGLLSIDHFVAKRLEGPAK